MFRRVQVPMMRAAMRPALRTMRPVAPVVQRGYASQADVKPPVQLFGLDGTYATALYTASAKDSSIETAEKTLKTLKELIKSDPKTGYALTDPSLTTSDKEHVIDVVTDAIKGDAIFKKFLEVLAANNRLDLLPGIIDQFEILSNAHKGLVEAVVTSAQPLDKSALKRITAAIQGSEYVGAGKTLKLDNVVDPTILGGLVVAVGDRTVDLSVTSKLQKFNHILAESV